MKECIKCDKKCKDCSANKFPKKNEQIGKPILHRTSFGRGHMNTEYIFYQCQVCGTLWERIEDTGAGGYDSHTRKIT